jgi:thiamine biosynthesis lipoprotein
LTTVEEWRDALTTTPIRFESRAMGSPLRLTLGSGAPPAVGAGLWSTVRDEFERSEQAMSRFRQTSELTLLNRTAGTSAVCHPSQRLRLALVTSDRAWRVTDGRFDPRVLVDLERLGYRGAAVDEPRVTVRTVTRADHVVRGIRRRGLSIAEPIDLGGIGKGLALRWAAARLGRAGARDFLVEAGGDVVARGNGPDGKAWHIGIEDPHGGDESAVIAVTDLAIATSSIRVNRWVVDGRVVHHLLDPRTGEPANGGLVAVTVAGPDPAWAEVWSKALYLAGRAAIANEARSQGRAAWWVTEDGAFEMTPAARALTIWVSSEAD